MMRKIECPAGVIPLHTQYISIIEIGGAHAHIFNQFLNFIGVKTLIITDIDSCDDNREKCSVSEGTKSSNSGLNHFFGKSRLTDLTQKSGEDKIFEFDLGWKVNSKGNLRIAYQTKEDGYHARSFEDAFIHINREFISNSSILKDNISNQYRENINTENAYALAESINSKSGFATDILFVSVGDYSDWNIPQYIKEGLEWLQQ